MLPLIPAAILMAAPPAQETPRPLATVCDEAVARFKAGSLDEGMKLLDEAQKAHPRSAKPHWMRAQVHLAIAGRAKGHAAAWYRRLADDELETVYWNPDSTRDEKANVQVLLDEVHGADYPDVSTKDPEAIKAFQEAETHYGAREFPKARAAYARALERDPGFILAMLYIGDTYHANIGDPEAMAWYRKAAEARPTYPKAWRFLSDACIEAGQPEKAEEALMAGLAGHPGNRLLWLKLAGLRDQMRRPMKKLDFAPPLVPDWNAKGQLTLAATHAFVGFEGQTIWPVLLAGILGGATVEVKDPAKGAPPMDTPFQKELLFWTLAMETLQKHVEETHEQPQDRFLAQFLRFKQDGKLEAAVLLLRYQEAFRPDLEAWKKAHPGALQAFIREYGYRP